MDIIARNVKRVELSGIRRFFNKVAEYPGTISLTLGQPDFKVPEAIKTAMIKAIEENKTVYTTNAGILELRQEISSFLNSFNIEYSPEEICLTVGGSEGLMTVFTTIINPGDKVLIPTPSYPSYESIVKILGGEVVNYILDDMDFSLSLEELKRKLEIEGIKAMVISYPSNPTGGVLSKKDKKDLYEIIKEKDIMVITDEIYSSLYFEEEYNSIAQYKDILDKVILISGFSKMFSMTGLRLGYVCATKKVIKDIIKVHQYSVSCAPSISQYGALKGLKDCLKEVKEMSLEYERRRDYVYNKLRELGFQVFLPKGAFYIFPSIKRFGLSSEEFCQSLLAEGKVAIVPGSAFGIGGEGYIRISYAYSMEELEEAFKRLEAWMRTKGFIEE